MSSSAFIRFLKDAENKGSLSYQEALPLSGVSTVGTGGAADFFVLPCDIPALISVIKAAKTEGVPYYTVGNSSDLFFSDFGFRGAIVCTKKLSKIALENGKITAEAGCMMPSLSAFAQKNGLSGFEGLCSIPGTVGGGLCLNASAYGQSISDLLYSFSVYLPEKDVIIKRTKEDAGFSYRKSEAAKEGGIILSAEFDSIPENPEIIAGRMKENRQKRKNSQPIGEKSAGSFYKRPGERVFAGELIDRLGFKGFYVGGAAVSEKHANFFINRGGATSSDFEKLSDMVCLEVFKKTGIVLQKEVIFVKES